VTGLALGSDRADVTACTEEAPPVGRTGQTSPHAQRKHHQWAVSTGCAARSRRKRRGTSMCGVCRIQHMRRAQTGFVKPGGSARMRHSHVEFGT
jgi:formate dehydrogenase assembly factor FdhD